MANRIQNASGCRLADPIVTSRRDGGEFECTQERGSAPRETTLHLKLECGNDARNRCGDRARIELSAQHPSAVSGRVTRPGERSGDSTNNHVGQRDNASDEQTDQAPTPVRPPRRAH